MLLKNDNVDDIKTLWMPDAKECTAQSELRRIEEWKRSGGGTKRPSSLGIESYHYGNPLPEKFYEGRFPPPVALDSAENLEWYSEQLHRCVYGFEYQGIRITGDHYWFLNFTPFLIAKKNKQGEVTTNIDIGFAYFSYQHDYIFKLIEEAHSLGKGFMWMAGRAVGKTYIILSILAKNYYLKPNSHNVVSASHSGHAGEAFGKLKDMLLAIETAHPTLALARLTDTKYFVKAGYEINIDGIKKEQGPMSKLQQVIYGDNPGVTRGSRPDTFLMEEVGDWSTGKGNLKECFSASLGSWRIGSIYKTRLFLIGTGGSVASDQAKDLFTRPDGYNLLSVDDFVLKAGKKHCVFTPAHYLYGGAGWERTAVNNDTWSKDSLTAERKLKEEDTELYNRFVQEYPFTVEEVFKKSGTNIFHQRNIAKQWSDIQFGAAHIVKPEVGFLEWQRSKSGKINGVTWAANPGGNIEIVEHPYHGKDGKGIYRELYVAGVDSIDQGQLDSTTNKDRSSLAMLVKKRIVDGEYFKHTSNLYVAKYIGRSLDVRDDYEEVLKLTMYYSAKVNIEYTRIGLVQYFREKKQWHTLMKRPAVAKSAAGSSDPVHVQKLREQTLIGTTTSTSVIDYGDGKIKEYTRDHCHNIFFTDVLEQLRDYQRESRTAYDLVIAMALCEIADEDLLGIPAKENGADTRDFVEFGFYTNEKGIRKRGVIPKVKRKVTDSLKESELNGFRWIDMNGRARFDDQFEVLDLEDLESV